MLLVDAPRGHPQFMTIGHYIAVEDGGSQFDPNNYGPECGPCNYSDGARRTNAKRGVPYNPRTRTGQASPPPPAKFVDDNWYEAYQAGVPLALDPSITRRGCPICGNPVPKHRTYCTSDCRTEYRRRTARARTDRRDNRPVRDLSLPTRFKAGSFITA